MALSEQKLDRLDDLLLDMPDGTMLLSELDGFLTGIILCPLEIASAEWLPLIWGEGEEPQGSLFQQADLLKEATGLIMTHFNGLSAKLESPSHEISPEFCYSYGSEIEEILWESWVVGFFDALRLRLDAWTEVLDSANEDAIASLSMLSALEAIDSDDSEFSREEQENLIELAPGLIPFSITGLNKWRLSQRQGPPKAPVKLHEKLGRNDPCPCGSGKKFKKCCGAG